jgi:hypothetical protein
MSIGQLIHLLDFDTKKMLINTPQKVEQALGMGLILTRVALLACQHFQDRNYKQFDALVGESQCQIRAAKLAKMTRGEVKDLSVRIMQLEDIREIYRQPHSSTKMPLGDFLLSLVHDPHMEDDDLLFLVLSHLLFITREEINERPNSNHLLLIKGETVAVRHVKLLMFRAKEELARRSVSFMEELALESGDLSLSELIQRRVVVSNIIRSACYIGLQVILRVLQDAIIVRIHHAGDTFDVPLGNGSSDAAIVIEAESKHAIDLQQIDMVEAILANAAQHYQFVRENDSPITNMPEHLAQNFERHKNMPLPFNIKHIFAERRFP